MAIERHMLQATHPLFEKAGEVLEGVAKLKERIAELNGNIAQLEDDNALLRKNNAELRKENEELKQKLHTAEVVADLTEAACEQYREFFKNLAESQMRS